MPGGALFTCIGEMLIDFTPECSGGTGADGVAAGMHPARYLAHPGGSVANVAVALARLGANARFIGALSRDAFGEMLAETLRREGVDISALQRNAAPTALALVMLTPSGDRAFSFYGDGAAHTLLDAAELPVPLWQSPGWCCTGSVVLTAEPARSTVLGAMQAARTARIPVAFDVNVRRTLWPSEDELREVLRQALAGADVVKVSEEDAPYLMDELSPLDTSEAEEALARAILDSGPSLVALTLGPRGCFLSTERERVRVPGVATRAIDTTGAGDAWLGAFLCTLARAGVVTVEALQALPAETIYHAGAFANAAAALSATRPGGIASLPRAAELPQANGNAAE